ncbi:MAG: SDR family NAD(P)-dependent oxidoreductase [Candidatus Bathyarchaeales archaeon]
MKGYTGKGKVLVTGGAGFIGSHLVDRLVREGFEVAVFDNFSTGSLENVKYLSASEGFSFVRGDVADKRRVDESLKDVDVVFHLAAVTSVPFSVKNPVETFRVNVEGTRNLLEACLNTRVERFVYVSSCAVYGEAEYLPIDEKHPTKPASPYAESKFEAERLCAAFHELYGLKIVTFRLFNVYGPRMRRSRYSGVITRFIERLSVKKPPVIYGDGAQTRDFIHVSDVVEAMMLSLDSGSAVGETFNVGFGTPTTINHLAQLLGELLGAGDVKPLYRRAREGDVKHSYADIGRARETFGFEPKINLKEGLLTLLPKRAKGYCEVEKC